MIPQPLPHPNDDPAFNTARQAAQTFTTTAQTIRGDVGLSDLARAQQIKTAYDTYATAVQAAYKDLTARRRARYDYLESLLPVGPGIPDGTSPADRAVLMTAFRNAYDQARNASSRKARAELLAQAERFDDDALRRGTFTALVDLGDTEATQQWAALHIGQADYLPEVAELRDALAGRGTAHMWDLQVFAAPTPPAEVNDLPRLLAAAQQPAARYGVTTTHH